MTDGTIVAPRIFPHEYSSNYEVDKALNEGKKRGVPPPLHISNPDLIDISQNFIATKEGSILL